MYELLLELLVEFWAVVGLGLATSVLTGLGIMAELSGFHQVTTGDSLGYWFLFMGGVALVAAYLLAVDELLPRLREARRSRAGPE